MSQKTQQTRDRGQSESPSKIRRIGSRSAVGARSLQVVQRAQTPKNGGALLLRQYVYEARDNLTMYVQVPVMHYTITVHDTRVWGASHQHDISGGPHET